MSESMIERVARAAYFAGEGLDPESAFSPDNDAHWQHWWKEDRTLHEAVGRAAIEAMRESTDEMRVAALTATFDSERGGDRVHVQDVPIIWRAMIDAALS